MSHTFAPIKHHPSTHMCVLCVCVYPPAASISMSKHLYHRKSNSSTKTITHLGAPERKKYDTEHNDDSGGYEY